MLAGLLDDSLSELSLSSSVRRDLTADAFLANLDLLLFERASSYGFELLMAMLDYLRFITGRFVLLLLLLLLFDRELYLLVNSLSPSSPSEPLTKVYTESLSGFDGFLWMPLSKTSFGTRLGGCLIAGELAGDPYSSLTICLRLSGASVKSIWFLENSPCYISFQYWPMLP